MNVAAFVSDGGEFVEAIGESGGIERESVRESRDASGDIEMIAGLEIRKISIEGRVDGGTDDQSGRTNELGTDAGGCQARVACAQRKDPGPKGANSGILSDYAIAGLEVGTGVDIGEKLGRENGDGTEGVSISVANADLYAVGLSHSQLQPGAGIQDAVD